MKSTRILAALLVIAILTLLLSACGAAEKLQEYDLSGDMVKTINALVGERKVLGVETGTENGVLQKQYTYQSTSVMDDLTAYITYLQANGWLATQDYDLNVLPGSMQFAIQSKDEGNVVVLSIAYEETAYALKFSKLEGTLE